jgi:hypothetical protein
MNTFSLEVSPLFLCDLRQGRRLLQYIFMQLRGETHFALKNLRLGAKPANFPRRFRYGRDNFDIH